jgi:hypothetical protein
MASTWVKTTIRGHPAHYSPTWGWEVAFGARASRTSMTTTLTALSISANWRSAFAICPGYQLTVGFLYPLEAYKSLYWCITVGGNHVSNGTCFYSLTSCKAKGRTTTKRQQSTTTWYRKGDFCAANWSALRDSWMYSMKNIRSVDTLQALLERKYNS